MTASSRRTAMSTAVGMAAALLLAGCAATGDGASQGKTAGTTSKAASGDWAVLSQKDLATRLAGNTMEETAGKWAVYYAPDGRKAVWVRNGETRTRKWHVNDKGEWCETLYRDGAERCGPQLQASGNQLRKATQYGAVEWTVTVREGNPRRL